MIRIQIISFLLFFAGFYGLFWNYKKWNRSTIRLILASIGCGILSVIALTILLFIITTVFD